MSTVEEQARAEAEREYPAVPIALRTLTYPADAMHQTRVGAYTRGYLAGHEAATRTREVTLDQVIQAITGACISDVSAYAAAQRVMALHAREVTTADGLARLARIRESVDHEPCCPCPPGASHYGNCMDCQNQGCAHPPYADGDALADIKWLLAMLHTPEVTP